ncbi:MAG: prepilin-type N-terminal cleavage/methylation domain-containing protein [Phycisphaerae bacterium]|nr:prepilin-type N-terminal cleavage/methylation domain-containing protein [Phycisphaerae bacterium]
MITPLPTHNPLATRARRGFSLVEMLVALAISATLLTASLVALDAMFKRYTAISDSAGTHVVSRMVMHRMLSMIRTGAEFGPYPDDVLDPLQNPVQSDFIEFVSFRDDSAGILQVTRLERRTADTVVLDGERFELRGPFALWLVIQTQSAGTVATQERPIVDGVSEVNFSLEYDVGPRLTRATIDLSVDPGGSEYSTYNAETGTWSTRRFDPHTQQTITTRALHTDAPSPPIRLIASTAPRAGT